MEDEQEMRVAVPRQSRRRTVFYALLFLISLALLAYAYWGWRQIQ
ncbi:MAG: hypothetical protein U1C49_00420 [Candidatus Andersenbacteria bacterium]|nr:hypothetical protein [Candidatus Andersenbacteria bacterium]